jgi:hypothetical protein
MKTASKKRDSSVKPRKSDRVEVPDEEVAVIVDVRNGAEYYMFMIDSFTLGKHTYAVMVPYEPERVRSKEAEIIIVRAQQAKNGDQLYISITDKKELDGAFDAFYKRFEESGQQ